MLGACLPWTPLRVECEVDLAWKQVGLAFYNRNGSLSVHFNAPMPSLLIAPCREDTLTRDVFYKPKGARDLALTGRAINKVDHVAVSLMPYAGIPIKRLRILLPGTKP